MSVFNFIIIYINKCGIGWHGDGERRKVIGVRLGETIPLAYLWYKNNKPLGKKIVINLNHGDLYIMSEKAKNNAIYGSSKKLVNLAINILNGKQ